MLDNGIKCAAFWNHTNVRGGNRVFPCCRYKSPVSKYTGDLISILDSQEYETLRKNSTIGIKDNNCSKCYLEEELGRKSLRQEFNEQYSTEKVELKYLEIGFDNICNLTCDGCWGEWSSAWSKKLNPDLPSSAHYTSIDEITTIPQTLEKVVFLGGEPLQTSRHSCFLDKLTNLQDIELTYYTNGMFLIKDVELLKKANKVNMILSIDAVEDLNEKVRSGSNWNQILKFIDQVKELKFNLSIHSVLHLNNWHGLADLEKFVKKINVDWVVNPLTFPKHLDVRNLINKHKIINLVNNTNIPNKDYILEFIKNDI